MNTDQRDLVGTKVRAFYEGCSYPGYEDFETPDDLVRKAHTGIYARLLDEQIPHDAKILDAGCGTGQLPVFLSMSGRQAFGVDMTYNSLLKGQTFKQRFNLGNVHFTEMNLFHPALREETFDYIFSNGVLHATLDAFGAFQNLVRLLKPGGYIIIGLYNTYGRLLLDLRRVIFRLTRGRLKWLDFYMRQKSIGEEKKRIWYRDQYEHPHEDKYSVDGVLQWFRKCGIQYINAVPPIRLGDEFTAAERLFEPHLVGDRLDHLLAQLGWIFSKSKEGGFFITIGRKSECGADLRGLPQD
jgi:SAM-dependent methyltransferase